MEGINNSSDFEQYASIIFQRNQLSWVSGFPEFLHWTLISAAVNDRVVKTIYSLLA